MNARSLSARASAVVLGLVVLAGPAVAEETDAERLSRLEEMVRRQAEAIERLEAELTRRREPAAPAPASTPAPSRPPLPPPPPPGASTPPVVNTGPAPAPSAPRSSLASGPPGVARPENDVEAWDAAVGNALSGSPAARRSYAQQIGGVRWGGYFTLEYIAPSDRNSFFDLHRLVFQFDAPIAERIGLNGEIEIEHGGFGGSLDGEVEVEYAEVLFQACDLFNPKVGAILIPFGRWNLYHDDPINDFTKRPWVGRYFNPTGFSQPGIGAEGAAPFGCGHAFTYNVALTSGFGEDFTTSSGSRSARQSWRRDNNEAKTVWGRFAALFDARAFDHLEVGVSGMAGKYDDASDHWATGFGTDLTLQKGAFEFKGEYIRFDIDRPATALAISPRGQWGLLLEAGYHFFPPFLCCGGPPFVTDTSHFTLAFRYQQMNLNESIRGGSFNDDLKSYGVGLNYRIQEGTVFRLDFSWLDGVNENRHEFTASFSTYF